MAPKLSIIIPTLNRSQTLRRTIQSIAELDVDFNLVEVIVVDNGSTDSTRTLCDFFLRRHKDIDIRYFYDAEPGLLTGRHLGAAEAQGEILAFIDDDVELSSSWGKTIINIMNVRSDVDMLTGPNLPKYETYPPEWLKWFWINTPYGGQQCGALSLLDLGNKELFIDATFVWGLNFTIRRNVYKELEGFHPDIVPKYCQYLQGDGETGLSIKFNEKFFKAYYHPGILLYHFVPSVRMTCGYFQKRYYFQGVSDSFTYIRRQNGLYSKISAKDENSSVIRKIKNIIKKTLHINSKSMASNEPRDVKELKQILNEKYREGFNFHQSCFNADPTIRKWVLRKNYLDYRLPTIKDNLNF